MNEENVHALKYREAKPHGRSSVTPVANLFRLDQRTIIITGVSGYLGTTAAKAIIESGGDVVDLDLVATPQTQARSEVVKVVEDHSRRLLYFPCDVRDAAGMADVIATLAPLLKHRIRGLVACAGVSDNGPATEFPIESFRRLLDINVTGTFAIAQLVAQQVLKSGLGASMVLVASMSGYVSNKGVDIAGYNSSKAAVQQLARSLAAEWGSRVGMPLIRVNSLSPGYIRTDATVETLKKPGIEEQWVADSMFFHLSTVDEFPAPVLFMLGDGSSYMTGADLRVDGGHCAW